MYEIWPYMLKISHTGKAGKTVSLKLEGRVVGAWVGELRQNCELLLGKGRKLCLDLADVSFADPDGVTTLTQFRARGVELVNCSPFLDQQLRMVRTN
jgi:anti-anti-sigma regulatory factor